MSNRIDTPLRGFCMPWFALSDITVKPVQAGPRPGAFVPDDNYSKGLVEVSNAQGADLDIRAVQGGGYNSAEFAVRAGAEVLSKKYAQWVAPNMLCDYHFIEATGVNIADAVPIVLPSTQELFVIVQRGSGIVSQQLQLYPFNQGTQTFDPNFDLDPDAPNCTGLGAGALPDGRLYFLTVAEEGILAYISENGLDWQPSASIHRFGSGFAPNHVATAQSLGNILAVFEDIFGKIRQYISTSLAGSFDLVGEFAAISEGESINATATRDGIFLVAYLANGTFAPTVARLGSASEPLDTAPKITLSGVSHSDIAICDTPSGVYVYARINGSAVVDVYYSSDEGATFTKMDRGAHSTVISTRYMEKFECIAYQGKVAFPFVINNGGAPLDEGAAMVFYGGWQNIAIGHAEQSSSSDILGRGSLGSGGNDVHTGIPLDVPHNVGWTQTTTGGTMAISNGVLRISTVAQSNFQTINPAGVGDDTIQLWKVTVQVGGSQATNFCAWVYNTLTSKWAIRYDTTGFTVRDSVAGTTLATVVLDMTKGRIFQAFDRIIGTARVITLAYRAPGSREWTIVLNEVSLDVTGVFAAVEINFGHIAPSATNSLWGIWSYSRETSVEFRTSEFDTQGTLGLIGHKLLEPTPLHRDFNDTDGKTTFLRMAGGSFHKNETGQIARTFDFSVDNLVPQENPGLTTKWRNTSRTEAVFEFTAPDKSGLVDRLGNSWSVALFVAGTNVPLMYLEYWNGLIWVTAGTWTAYTGVLDYDRNGSSITPAAGTPALDHYIRHSQYVGGSVLFSGVGARRIRSHGPGVWSDVIGSLAPKAVIHLEGVTAGDPASGSCTLNQSSALLIVHLAAPVYATKWRVRIPGSLTTPEDYYEAAIIAPMYFIPTGQQWSNGYSVDGKVARASVTDRNNTEYRQPRGGVKRLWTLPYADGFAAKNLVTNFTDPDYLAPDTGLSLIAASDVFPLLLGLLRETDGHIPIVAVRKAPAVTGMVHGVDDFLYGYLDGPAGFDNTAGDDTEATQFDRGSAVKVIEIV